MKIAQIAPINLPIPSEYGGVERVVENLTASLTARGHQVTVFCSGDSTIENKEHFIDRHISGSYMNDSSAMIAHLIHLSKSLQVAEDNFDIIHCHIGYLSHFFLPFIKKQLIITLHNPLPAGKHPERTEVLEKLRASGLVTISKDQRKDIPDNYFLGNVYNGVDIDLFSPGRLADKKEFLFWVGRLEEEKGAHIAIEIAKKAGLNIILAGKIGFGKGEEYFKAKIKPLIDNDSVIFAEELTKSELIRYYRQAKALLMPIQWDEPFGLTAIEAMACGTPVIAFKRGALSEIIEDKKNGYLIDNSDSVTAAEIAKKIAEMNIDSYGKISESARQRVLNNFSLEKMTEGYISIYEKALKIQAEV